MSFRLSRSILRPFQDAILRPRNVSRTVSSKVHKLSEQEPQDFRPPWFYTGVRMLSWTLIPGTALYAVFVYDFGDHDHVFQAPRRWAARKKAEFLTLTPEEKTLIGEEPVTQTKP